jgi:16S rRNA U516 pseudouridylate synthase RsuA-like enzyme
VKRLIILAMLWAVPAVAQQLSMAPKEVKKGYQATTFTPVTVSMSDMLNSGWSIVQQSMGLVFTLHKNNQWIVCEVDEGKMSGSLPGSQCFALN